MQAEDSSGKILKETVKVSLILAPKQKIENLRISIREDWPYFTQEVPYHTIKFTLRKFKILQNPEEEDEVAKKYRIYRVREDPSTKFRYVTEILNKDEAAQLVPKRGGVLLIAYYGLVQNPQEDFKRILDEAQRLMSSSGDEQSEEEKKGDEGMEEPPTQTSGHQPHRDSSSENSSMSSAGSAEATKVRMKGKLEPEGLMYGEDHIIRFQRKYPHLIVTGKLNEQYKCPGVLDYIKQTQNNEYADLEDFNQSLISKLNRLHGQGGDEEGCFYESRITPSYINIRCGINKRCRFAMWYKFEKNNAGDPVQIKWFRTINNNHDYAMHKVENGLY